MNENGYTLKLRRAMEHMLPGSWFYKASDRFHAGIPDVLGMVHGQFVAIEVKVAPNGPTDLQVAVLRDIARAGGVSILLSFKRTDKTLSWQDVARDTRHNAKTIEEFVTWLSQHSCLPTRQTPSTILSTSPTALSSSSPDSARP